MQPITATVLIPTYKRARYLQQTLEAFTHLNSPPDTFEVLIVDNNSPDHTREVVAAFAEAHSAFHIRYVFEGRQGVSYARNRGITEAQGEIICLLDDDSPPEPEWLNALLSAFDDPTVGCVGGPAELDYQGQVRPPWLEGDLQGMLSGFSLPYSTVTPVSAWEQLPYSCNMAVRRRLFAELGAFRPDLDRAGNQALAAGDTEMGKRILEAGWQVLYNPEAKVRHIVAPERLKFDYLYHIGRGLAASHVILTGDPRPHQVLRWLASDLWYATRMLARLVLAVVRRKRLWLDDYIVFWTVARRIPYRLHKIFNGSMRA
ncbi:MAG: glycosyltransferase family 2 protein [Caldilineaceae bacterium]|nr:glycosyltransferase family 2 protein [Caldilineaceae bacterium]